MSLTEFCTPILPMPGTRLGAPIAGDVCVGKGKQSSHVGP